MYLASNSAYSIERQSYHQQGHYTGTTSIQACAYYMHRDALFKLIRTDISDAKSTLIDVFFSKIDITKSKTSASKQSPILNVDTQVIITALICRGRGFPTRSDRSGGRYLPGV